MEEIVEIKQFLSSELPALLCELQVNTKPAWGRMSATEMLVHIEAGLLMSSIDEERELLIPEEKAERYQAWLRSSKPFPEGSQKPAEFLKYETAIADFEEAKERFKKTLKEFLEFMEAHPDFSSIHPNFGRLDVRTWLHLHRKHFRHHLKQFGLINY